MIETNLKSLESEVFRRIGEPVNSMSVLATLESLGLYATDMQKDYGVQALEELAKVLFSRMQAALPARETVQPEQVPVSDYLWVRLRLFGTYYPLGVFHLLPVLVQIAAIIVFGYSLWASLGFNILQSTAVVMGVLLGLILSGGYVQLIGKQGGFYHNYRDKQKTLGLILEVYRQAVRGFALAFLILTALSYLFSLYPWEFLVIAYAYAFGIGMLLVVYAPYHTLKRRWYISFGFILATGLALYLEVYTELHTYLTHWIGMAAGIVIGLAGLLFFFRSLGWGAFRPGKEVNILMVISKNYRYFLYGALIYGFIFIDRMVAWSADTGIQHDFLFLYEKQYEIGMDLAILMFFMLVGVLEYAIASFSKFMDMLQKETRMHEYLEFNAFFRRMYVRHLLILMASALLGAWLIQLIIVAPWGYQAAFGETLSRISLRVCIIGGFGYFFLAWGMLNCLYMFTLNEASLALRSLFYAILINLFIGGMLSRFISFEYSSLGMLAGSLFFALYTSKGCLDFFRKLDHHYYAAY